MPDDQDTAQNQDSGQNSIPASPQEPMADAPILPIDSKPAEVPPEVLEAPREGFSDESNNIPPSNSTPTEAEKEQKTEEKQALNEPSSELVSEPAEVPEPRTAQTPVNEPLVPESKVSLARQLLISARNAIQYRKRKKLDRVMSMFLQQSKITNDEVEKFLHVSDATATRYLSILEKEGKIKQNGKTGHMVSYSRI